MDILVVNIEDENIFVELESTYFSPFCSYWLKNNCNHAVSYIDICRLVMDITVF